MQISEIEMIQCSFDEEASLKQYLALFIVLSQRD